MVGVVDNQMKSSVSVNSHLKINIGLLP